MDYLNAFLCGGILCAVVQILIDKTPLTPARILTGYVVAGVLLTAVGIYEPLVEWGGAGATVPLTGFGYSLASGVKKAVASGKALLVLVDEGASANTRKLFTDACAHYGVPLHMTQRERLGLAMGKSGRMSAAVARGPLGEKLLALAQRETGRMPDASPAESGKS